MWAALLMVAMAAGSLPYGNLRSRAAQITNLGRFLEEYIGDCVSTDPAFDPTACESEAEKARLEHKGRVLRFEFEDVQDRLQLAAWDERRQAYRLHLTPLFTERALGMSVGKPSRLNADGEPVVKNVPIWVKRPAGEAEFTFRRELERGRVRLEILIEPEGTWRFKRQGEEIRGMSIKLVGLRLYRSRGDEVLAEQTY